MELPLIVTLLFLTTLKPSSAEETRESKKLPEKYLQIPEKIIGGVIDIVQNHKNKQPYAQASYQQGFQANQGNYQGNGNQGYQHWSSQNNQNNQLQGQFIATNQGGQGYIQFGSNQPIYPTNQAPNYQGQTQIQISNQQSNNQYQGQNQQNGNQFQNQLQSNQFQNQNQIQNNNRYENVISSQQTGQYQISQQRPQYQGGNNGYGQYQGNTQGGTNQNVNQQIGTQYPVVQQPIGTQYPVVQQPITPVTQYPTLPQNGGQYQGNQVINQENYYQGSQFGGGNYQSGQTTTGQYQNGSQFNQGSLQTTGSIGSQGSSQTAGGQPNSGPGPTCICQAWTKPLSDDPVDQYTPAPKTEQKFEPTTLLM